MKQFLIAICGIPASGKTRLSKAIALECGCHDVHVVSTDDWRDEEYHREFIPENERRVRQLALDLTSELILKGHSVIHDDTNYYKSMRHELFEIAREAGCVFSVVHVTTPLETALQWNRMRDVVVPDDVITQINERLDVPGGRYAWDTPIIEADLSMRTAEDIASEIVARLEAVEPLADTHAEPDSDSANRLLDTVTRQTVARFLRDCPECRRDPDVHRIRREVLRQAREIGMDAPSAEQELWRRLGKLTVRAS